jgi:hypothetical protein
MQSEPLLKHASEPLEKLRKRKSMRETFALFGFDADRFEEVGP